MLFWEGKVFWVENSGDRVFRECLVDDVVDFFVAKVKNEGSTMGTGVEVRKTLLWGELTKRTYFRADKVFWWGDKPETVTEVEVETVV